MENKKLYRSTTDRKIAGVCGGIGEYFNIDPTIIRLVWAILLVPTALVGGTLVYFVAALIIPERV